MNGLLKYFARYQLPAIIWALVNFAASSIPASRLPHFTAMVNDKIIHASIFFILGLLVYRALEPRHQVNKFNWSRLVIAVAAVIIYGVTDEFHQAFVPGRNVDVLDALADAMGGLLAATIIYLQSNRKSQAKA